MTSFEPEIYPPFIILLIVILVTRFSSSDFWVTFNFQFLCGFWGLKRNTFFHNEAYKEHHISANKRSTISKFGMPLPYDIIYAYVSWIFKFSIFRWFFGF